MGTALGRLWKLFALTNIGRWKIARFNEVAGVENIMRNNERGRGI